MARKKVCLFIVEGASDETALGALIEKLVQNEAVVFDVFRTDIFSATQQRAGVDPIMHIEKMHDRIRAVTLKHLERADYSWKDLDRIVPLADTDGCFIPDDAVVEREGIDSICYLNDHIETASAGGTRFRNKEKSSRLWGVIKGRRYVTNRNVRIPVSVYFMSRNLEHALSNEAGYVSDRRKAWLAREFSSRYKDDIDSFVGFMCNEIAVPGDYVGSWTYIAEGTNSLSRGSNLHLFIQDEVGNVSEAK